VYLKRFVMFRCFIHKKQCGYFVENNLVSAPVIPVGRWF